VLNSLGAHLMAGLSAALVMGAKAGLRPRDMLEVIQGGAFSSPLFAAKGQRILQGNFEPDFSLSLLRKDQRLVAENAAAAGVPMPIHQAILAVLDDAVQAGLGEQDLCALIRWFERPAGIEVRDKT
jgi:3-hydroxyisobutyrate dehydrogenase-like beta-hydroxyacid dehydrogenase